MNVSMKFSQNSQGNRPHTYKFMDTAIKQTANIEDRQITATRIFDAPRELVWKTWTDPAHISNWWGPEGFSTTTETMDVRPGGVWKHVMHGPDGTDYPNETVFIEVVEPERLRYTNSGGVEDRTFAKFESVVTFTDMAGKTELTVKMTFESAKIRDKIAEEYGAIEGLHQMLGRLKQFLASAK
jgi:uncharacterized protein YndB with AHSA1/START domain